ncbi:MULTISPECIES: SGNH/GDSL hydrolase family protein [Shewanella]|uniref:SGNH/GDSL hydrolase family protein n=1 Tax=Shewanella TaxID=22 RepID=UPI001E5F71F4|nr:MULTISPECIES: SGNH/GDSL hydrolase family protein [Shewanella]
MRKNIPILAEATGGRSGRLGEGRPLSLLVVGDSAAAGVGVETQDDALSGCLTRELAQKYCVDWSLVAKSGNTTADLIETLQGRPFQTDSLSVGSLPAKVLDDNWLDKRSAPDIDVVLVSLGVNDLLSPIGESHWIAQQVRLIKLLKSKFSAKHILMTAVPPMHCFPALPQPLRWFLGLRASEFNRKLVSLIELESECELVIIPLMPIASDMASDGFHPSAKVYRLWGGTAAKAIEKRIESLLHR